MLAVLLWNLNRKPLQRLIASLAMQHQLDVLILLECDIPTGVLLDVLRGVGRFEAVPSNPGIAVYVKFSSTFCKPISLPFEEKRVNLWHIRLPLSATFLLGAAHAPDRRNYPDEGSRRLFCRSLAEHVASAEFGLGHKRSVVVGDFNSNPFDEAIASTEGLHAIRLKAVGGKSWRTVQKERFNFFYNPMWTCFGRNGNPPGSYFYYGYKPHELFWHLIDQVVLRPDMLPHFMDDDLRILTRANDTSLVSVNGIPDTRTASDHLPLLFRLNLRLR